MSPPPPAPQTQSPFLWLFLAGFCLLFGLPITGLGAMEVGPQIELGTSGTKIVAKVTDSRIMKSRRRTDHEVRYRFKVKGKAYTNTDATGRKNLWGTIPEASWKKAVKTGKVPVLFLKRDPWQNRLADAEMAVGDAIAGLGLGLFCTLGGLLCGIAAVRSWLSRRSAV